jgi:hypothetical protein
MQSDAQLVDQLANLGMTYVAGNEGEKAGERKKEEVIVLLSSKRASYGKAPDNVGQTDVRGCGWGSVAGCRACQQLEL